MICARYIVFLIVCSISLCSVVVRFFCQAEDGIRDLVRSRGLGDVYKRQTLPSAGGCRSAGRMGFVHVTVRVRPGASRTRVGGCLLYTSDAADERSSVDLGGRRIIKKKNKC